MKYTGFVLLLLLCACGPNATKDAQEICDCFEKANALPDEDPKRIQEQDRCSEIQLKKLEHYTTDADRKKFNDALEDCGQKLIEQALDQAQ